MILLWDIDGTLLDTGGSGVQPLVDAIKKHTGLEITFHRENVSGLTDYEIVQKLIVEKRGNRPTDVEISEILDTHISNYRIILEQKPAIQIDEISQKLTELELVSGIQNGILSGNCEEGAKIKLSSAKLEKFFQKPFIFTANCALNSRVKIVRAACRVLPPDHEVILIGDTPNDIVAAQQNGVRIVSIPTGTFTYEELKKLNQKDTLQEKWKTSDLLERIFYE